MGSRVDVPIVVIPTMPGWIGPLDVVVLVGDDAGDPALVDAGARSVRRRAEVVVLAPLEGPLRDAVAGRVIDLSPRVQVAPEFRFCGMVAGLLAICAALSQVRTTGAVLGVSTNSHRRWMTRRRPITRTARPSGTGPS